ncbi:Protein kinase protein rad53, partial [Maublancomyces gigas]
MVDTITVWNIDRVLGSGNFGIVSLHRERRTGELRAVKVISKSHSGTQELATLVYLRDHSRHFVQFLGWFEDGDSIHIAMEYIAHGDLYQYITQYPGDAKTDAKSIARQILTGLVVLHGREICHRDLKPQNILIASRRPILVKITDFGVSKHWGGTSLRTNCGTPCYQAPEQLGLLSRDMNSRGNSYTNAIDLWAVGAIVHQMLTSEIPFLNTNQGSFLSDLDFGSSDKCSATIDIYLLVDYCRNLIPYPTESLLAKGADRDEIDFVKSVMTVKPRGRLTAVEALGSVWVGGTVPSTAAVIPPAPGVVLPS